GASIAIIVASRHTQGLPVGSSESGVLCPVGKSTVPQVLIEPSVLRVVVCGRAGSLDSVEVAELEGGAVELHVGSHVQIEPAVAVRVKEDRAGAPSMAVQRNVGRNVAEPAAFVVEQGATVITRQEKIDAAVIVEIAGSAPQPAALHRQTRC